MRSSKLFFLALPAVATTAAYAQDAEYEAVKNQYCEICPYDAPITPGGRDSFSGPTRTTTIIKAEDMRALGVVSVAEMMKQLEETVGDTAEATDSPAPTDENANEEVD